MANSINNIDALSLNRRKEHELTQEQLGEKERMSKSDISADIIHYIVMALGRFARQFKLPRREACNYLLRFKGLEFVINNYEAEHQLSLQDCVDDMTAVCQRNGGYLG